MSTITTPQPEKDGYQDPEYMRRNRKWIEDYKKRGLSAHGMMEERPARATVHPFDGGLRDEQGHLGKYPTPDGYTRETFLPCGARAVVADCEPKGAIQLAQALLDNIDVNDLLGDGWNHRISPQASSRAAGEVLLDMIERILTAKLADALFPEPEPDADGAARMRAARASDRTGVRVEVRSPDGAEYMRAFRQMEKAGIPGTPATNNPNCPWRVRTPLQP